MEQVQPASYDISPWFKRLATSKVFWILFCGFFFGYPLIKSINRELPDPLPILYKVPDFNLINQHGKPFGSNDLKGKVYIANFFFTSCPSVCPRLMEEMGKIQHRVRGLGTNIGIVSFTVDPETDTPEQLKKKSNEYGANPFIWNFVTGDKKKLEETVIGGFKMVMGDPEAYGSLDLYDIAHSEKLVLVDARGNIRGFYSSDKDGINRMMIDIGLLVNRESDYLKQQS